MDAVKSLIDKYQLADPVKSDAVGEFSDMELAQLYKSLVSKGEISLTDALRVGATIEDLDLFDIATFELATDNQDISLIYDNLAKGSRNHMRSYYDQLLSRGVVYQATYINDEELKLIINSPQETGHN